MSNASAEFPETNARSREKQLCYPHPPVVSCTTLDFIHCDAIYTSSCLHKLTCTHASVRVTQQTYTRNYEELRKFWKVILGRAKQFMMPVKTSWSLVTLFYYSRPFYPDATIRRNLEM